VAVLFEPSWSVRRSPSLFHLAWPLSLSLSLSPLQLVLFIYSFDLFCYMFLRLRKASLFCASFASSIQLTPTRFRYISSFGLPSPSPPFSPSSSSPYHLPRSALPVDRLSPSLLLRRRRHCRSTELRSTLSCSVTFLSSSSSSSGLFRFLRSEIGLTFFALLHCFVRIVVQQAHSPSSSSPPPPSYSPSSSNLHFPLLLFVFRCLNQFAAKHSQKVRSSFAFLSRSTCPASPSNLIFVSFQMQIHSIAFARPKTV
jgi:hypothetical protein